MNSIEDNGNVDSHLVLRTVYIKKSVDDILRKIAFKLGRSKNDIIRHGIDLALKELEMPLSKKTDIIPIN